MNNLEKCANTRFARTVGNRAFTLVELIVVITILAILGTIAFISLQGYSRDARDSTRLSDIKNTEVGLELFTIKVGRYPVPDNSVSYTGGSAVIKQGILGKTVANNAKLSKIIVDPSTKANYVYSTFGNGKYYQLAANMENLQANIPSPLGGGLGRGIIPQANAATPVSAMVKGNYTFDPILPSIILVPSSVTSSGIFDKNVCFVMNGGKNTLNNCVETKNQMSLKSIDKNLVAYYDMETIFNSGGTDYMKDLSGNSYDLVFSGTILPTSTGGIIGKGYYFAGTGTSNNINYSLMQSEKVLKYNNSKELTVSVIVKTEETCPLNPNNFTGPDYGSSIIEYSTNFNTNTGAFVLDESDYSNLAFTKECNTSGNFRINLLSNNYSIVRSNKRSITGVWKNIIMKIFYSKDGIIETQLYINGVKQSNITSKYKNKITQSILDYILYIGSAYNGQWSYKGVIDDIKIYNRALSDAEIMQQSKILGF